MPRLLPLLALALSVAGCDKPAPAPPPAAPPAAAPAEAGELKKLPPGTHKETADVPGVGPVKYAVSVPAGYDGTAAVPLALVLHYGYDGAAPKPYTGLGMLNAFKDGLAKLNAVAVAPDVVGDDWTAPKNERAAVWLTRSAMKTYRIDPKKVVVTGFSMGGEGVWSVGAKHQDLFTGAVPVAAPVGRPARWTIPIYVIHSDRDSVVSYAAAKRHADAVKAGGATLEFKTVKGVDHYSTGSYAPFVGEAVEWLQGRWK